MPPLFPLRQTFQRQSDTSYPRNNQTEYPMYNEFLSSIAPMRMRRIHDEQFLQNEQLDRQLHMDNRPVPVPMMPNPNFAAQTQAQAPMNVRLDNQITPYQAANLERQNRALDNQIATRGAAGDIADRRMDLTEAGGTKLDQISATAKAAIERVNANNIASGERNTADNEAAMARVNRQAIIQTKLKELENTQGIEAAKVKADLERELIDLRGDQTRKTQLAPKFQQSETPSQSRVARNDKAMKFVNQYPQYSKYVTADKNGFTITSSGDPKIDSFVNAAIYGDEVGPTERTTDINLPGAGKTTEPVKADVVTAPATGDKRTRAIAALKAGNKVVNEATIAKIMARLK